MIGKTKVLTCDAAGTPIWQNVLDLWTIQETIAEMVNSIPTRAGGLCGPHRPASLASDDLALATDDQGHRRHRERANPKPLSVEDVLKRR